MNLSKAPLLPYVILSLALTLFSPIFFPEVRLFYLLPCLIVLYYQKTLFFCLWASFAIGLALDLLAPGHFIGLQVTSTCAATTLMYAQKRHFFADNLSTLPLLTFFTSIVATLLELALAYIFHKKIILGNSWFLTNLLFMPLLDGAYAFIFFVLPGIVFGKPRQRGADFFLHSTQKGS